MTSKYWKIGRKSAEMYYFNYFPLVYARKCILLSLWPSPFLLLLVIRREWRNGMWYLFFDMFGWVYLLSNSNIYYWNHITNLIIQKGRWQKERKCSLAYWYYWLVMLFGCRLIVLCLIGCIDTSNDL